jgi:hypothetical protein
LKIQLKRSNVLELGSAKEPTSAQMEYGELAVNYNNGDPAIFLKDSNDKIIRIAGVGNINAGDNPSGDVLPPTGNNVGDIFFNTSNNTLYYWDGTVWVPIANDVTAADIFVGTLAEIDVDVPAATRRNGFLWWNTEDGTLYIWYIDPNTSQFVIAIPSSGGGSGASVVVNNLPPTGPNQGDMWWNTTDGRLYIWYQDVDTGQWVDASPDSQVNPITSGEGFPPTGSENDMFFNTTDGRLYIYYNDGSSLQWVDASPDSQGAIYWNRNGTTLKPANDGDDVTVGDWYGGTTAYGARLGGLGNKLRGNTPTSTILDCFGGSGNSTTDGMILRVMGTELRIGGYQQGGGTEAWKAKFTRDGYLRIGGTLTDATTNPNITLNPDGNATFSGNVISTGTGRFNTSAIIGFADQSQPNPATGVLQVNGAVVLNNVGSGTGQTVKYNTTTGRLTFDGSSARYKDNIRDSDVGLAELMQLRSVKFEYKEGGSTDIGFIAEEVFPIIPEYVSLDEEGKPQGVAYDRMVSLLTKSLQEALIRIEALEAEVQALKGGN